MEPELATTPTIAPPADGGRVGHARSSRLDSLVKRVSTPTALIATLSVFAGGIHLYAVPEHLREWWVFGTFFLAVGVAQVAFGLLVGRFHSTALVLAAIWGNVFVVLVYVLSRTKGVPIGPLEHGEHLLETAGPLDLTATAMEVLLAGCLLALLPARLRPVTLNALFFTGLGLWALRFLGVLG